jgi:hypothetical protein
LRVSPSIMQKNALFILSFSERREGGSFFQALKVCSAMIELETGMYGLSMLCLQQGDTASRGGYEYEEGSEAWSRCQQPS